MAHMAVSDKNSVHADGGSRWSSTADSTFAESFETRSIEACPSGQRQRDCRAAGMMHTFLFGHDCLALLDLEPCATRLDFVDDASNGICVLDLTIGPAGVLCRTCFLRVECSAVIILECAWSSATPFSWPAHCDDVSGYCQGQDASAKFASHLKIVLHCTYTTGLDVHQSNLCLVSCSLRGMSDGSIIPQ